MNCVMAVAASVPFVSMGFMLAKAGDALCEENACLGTYVNGICAECGDYQAATLNENAVLTADIDMTGLSFGMIAIAGLAFVAFKKKED